MLGVGDSGFSVISVASYRPSRLGLVSENKRKLKNGGEYDKLILRPKGTMVVINEDAEVEDTIKEIQKLVKETSYQVRELAKVLKGNTLRETCKNIFDFCYDHIQYRLDDEGTEQLHEPARIWAERYRGVDCDDYAILASAILTELGIPHTLRLAEYAHKGYFQHIYVIVPKPNGGYFTIDPVKDRFDDEHNTKQMPLTGKQDIDMSMTLQRLGGIGLLGLGNSEDIDLDFDDGKGNYYAEAEYLKANADTLAKAGYDLKKAQDISKRPEDYGGNVDFSITSKPEMFSKEWWKQTGWKWAAGTAGALILTAGALSFVKSNDKPVSKKEPEATNGIAGTSNKKGKRNKGSKKGKSKPYNDKI